MNLEFKNISIIFCSLRNHFWYWWVGLTGKGYFLVINALFAQPFGAGSRMLLVPGSKTLKPRPAALAQICPEKDLGVLGCAWLLLSLGILVESCGVPGVPIEWAISWQVIFLCHLPQHSFFPNKPCLAALWHPQVHANAALEIDTPTRGASHSIA